MHADALQGPTLGRHNPHIILEAGHLMHLQDRSWVDI